MKNKIRLNGSPTLLIQFLANLLDEENIELTLDLSSLPEEKIKEILIEKMNVTIEKNKEASHD